MIIYVRYCYLSVVFCDVYFFFFFSSRRRHTRFDCDWSSDVCSSDLVSPLLGKLVEPDVVGGDEMAPLEDPKARPPDLGRRLAGRQHGGDRGASDPEASLPQERAAGRG